MAIAFGRKSAAWVGICIACVAGFEGLRTSTYFDVGGVPTACFGETKGIRVGDKFTVEQCKQMLGDRIEKDFGPGVDRCVQHELPPARKAAYVSIAYNIGIAAFCGSTIVKKENAGDPAGACDAMLKWTKIRVAGVLVTSRGLTNRRAQERELCMEGLE